MEVNSRSFGILIAYVIPGWVLLLSASYTSETVADWLSGSLSSSPTVAGFLFASLASIGLGVFTSTVRWLTIDKVIHALKITPSERSYRRFAESHHAIESLVQEYYRYYQFHANLAVALPLALSLRWTFSQFSEMEMILCLLVTGVLFAGACDTLRKYYQRTAEVLNAN